MTGSELPRPDLDHVLEHTQGLWGELQGGRVLLTGGTGFFGRWMLESFLHANDELGLGAEAIVLTRYPTSFVRSVPHAAEHPATTMLLGDVRSFAFPTPQCSHILHLATETALDSSATASFTTAVAGTERVLQFAAATRARKLLFTSSGAVYGPQPPECARLSEEYSGAPSPQDISSGYGHGKRAAEFLCTVAAAHTDLEAMIARCFAFVGPLLPLDGTFAIGNFIRDALHRDHIHIRGDGTARRSYLYSADLAIWLWTILFRGASSRPYNVGSEVDLSISDLATLVKDVLKPEISIHIDATPSATALPARYVPETTRAVRELGLCERVTLRDSVSRTAQWYAAQHGRK